MNKKNIIHFTTSFSIIDSILNDSSLRVKNCEEAFDSGNKRVSSAAHPMVCFGEYSFEELDTKEITYGEYGIAFTKDWAENNKIHPVLYIDRNPVAAQSFATLLLARKNQNASKLPNRLRKPIMSIKCFIKNTYGYNSRLDINDFNFRDENEWRYVPTKEQIGGNLISNNRSTYSKNRLKYNQRLLVFPLKFSFTDIEMVFVKNEHEIQIINEKFKIDFERIRVRKWKYISPNLNVILPKNGYILLTNE